MLPFAIFAQNLLQLMTLFNRNNLNIGVGLGMLIPMAVGGLLIGILSLTELPLKTRTAALLGICCNIFVLRTFQNRRANQSVRGVVLATVAIAAVWLIWFYEEIMLELGR
jgi:hypothetical protein